MDLQHLRYFVAVADHLHFTRAARRLYVDQGALSGAIRRLEKDLGVRLFDRDSHSVELTAAGAALYPEALSLLAGAERLLTVAQAHRCAPVTTLRIGLFLGQHAAGALTEPILNAFRSRHPEIRTVTVDLDLFTWNPAIRHRFVDVALVRGPLGGDGIEFTPLFTEPRAVLVPNTHPLADAESVASHELEMLQREHWTARGAGPNAFHDFFVLGDVWDVRDVQRDGPPPWDLGDVIHQVRHGAVVGTVDLSTGRSLPRSAVAAVPIDGVAGVTTGVAYPEGTVADGDPAGQFLQEAQITTRELIGLVPAAAAAHPTRTVTDPEPPGQLSATGGVASRRRVGW
jgi:DNA-binding transcriptional LysR family regulator